MTESGMGSKAQAVKPPDDLNALNGLNELNKERSELGGFDAFELGYNSVVGPR